MPVLELPAAAKEYDVSGGDVTTIWTKGCFLFRPGTMSMSIRNKQRREVLYVESTRPNGTLTLQHRPWRIACGKHLEQ
jgi:hypothetical protein